MNNLNNILLKISNADIKNKENLLMIAKDEMFRNNEELFDLILSQSSIKSQNVIYEAIRKNVNKNVMSQLLCYSNDYKKQQRILKYYDCKIIFENELFFIDMINLESDFVERKLYECFKNNKIKSKDDYFQYRAKYEFITKIAKNNSSNKINKMTDEDYQLLKERRILKDNILRDIKDILRNFGYLGIDIPRVNGRYQNMNNITNSFNKKDYQKLFNIDDFGNEKLYVNGIIMNAKSELNFVELVIILQQILKKYKLDNYFINVSDKNIYNLITKYIQDNVSLKFNCSNCIKILSNNDKEIVNISKIESNIIFNINIDMILNYIINEHKENNIVEKNERNTLFYIRKENCNYIKIYDYLMNKYLHKYNGIIIYEDDVPKCELYHYCLKNNIKLVVYFDDDNEYKIINCNELLNDDSFIKQKIKIKNIERE